MAAIIRTILTVFFVIDCIALSIVVLMQKGKEQGLGAIAGEMTTTTESYWDRNKGRSAEGNLKRATKIMAVLFIVIAVILNMKF
ncbi:MAG TPA: preprotein translocase subunit SecG [Candidatus Scatomonas pullistercoris]|uniref:Protein-export membrane protein SecG n=1 Tax=Candidatus Scatomonas pullistercoris TaxID=2840920 RepID=A0A9D1P323_9FIRM|nr:preprotein translocase subunit SecG [Candidatus Scatomonas pullistercoris]